MHRLLRAERLSLHCHSIEQNQYSKPPVTKKSYEINYFVVLGLPQWKDALATVVSGEDLTLTSYQ